MQYFQAVQKGKTIASKSQMKLFEIAGFAMLTLTTKKIDGKSIICKAQDRLDRYNRYIGVCFLKELNLNKWMVRNGYAVAYRRYSKDYIEDEKYAKKNKLGLWSGNFISPDKWRKLN